MLWRWSLPALPPPTPAPLEPPLPPLPTSSYSRLQGIPLLRLTAWMRAGTDPNSPRTAPRDWATRTTLAHASQVRGAGGGQGAVKN